MDFSKLEKRSPPGAATEQAAGEEVLTAIVRVKRAGYRPANVTLRASIDECLFTAELPASQLQALRSDAGVESVSLGEPLPLQRPPRP